MIHYLYITVSIEEQGVHEYKHFSDYDVSRTRQMLKDTHYNILVVKGTLYLFNPSQMSELLNMDLL